MCHNAENVKLINNKNSELIQFDGYFYESSWFFVDLFHFILMASTS